MTTNVLLIRHAAHDRLDRVLCGRSPGVSLGKAGRRDAARLADKLAMSGLSAIYASPLERTLETAEPLATRTGLTVSAEADLNEIDVGAWTGRSFEALGEDPEWSRWNRLRVQSRPPAGETLVEVQVRVIRFLDRMRLIHPEQTIAAVSHSEPIKAALCWAMGLSLECHARLEVSPASISRVVVGDWGAKVWSCNEAPA